MSKRNTLAGKSERRNDREYKGCGLRTTRSVASDVPAEARLAILSNPKEKLSRSVRRGLKNAGDVIIDIPRTPARRLEVKNALRLTKLPLTRVIRELKKTARRVSTLSHRAQKATLGSKLRAVFENAVQIQTGYLGQIRAEYAVRLNPQLKSPTNESL